MNMPDTLKTPIVDQFDNVIGELENLFELNPLQQNAEKSGSPQEDFMKIHSAQASIRARSRDVMTINLVPIDLKEGYLLRNVRDNDIFLGECLVTNENNTCQFLVINTSDDDLTITVNPSELLDYEYYTPSFESDSDSNFNPIADRVGQIKQSNNIIVMSHLDEEEKSHVQNLISDYYDVFFIIRRSATHD